MKKTVSLILALALCLTLALPAAAAEPPQEFYVVPMYTLNGQVAYIWSYDVGAYQAVGWYLFFDAVNAAVDLGVNGKQYDTALLALDFLAGQAPEHNDYIYQCKAYVTNAKYGNAGETSASVMSLINSKTNDGQTWMFYEANDTNSITSYYVGYGDAILIPGEKRLVLGSYGIIIGQNVEDYKILIQLPKSPYETCAGVLQSDEVEWYGAIFYITPAYYTRDSHIDVIGGSAEDGGIEAFLVNHGFSILLDKFRDYVLTPNGYTLADLGFTAYV